MSSGSALLRGDGLGSLTLVLRAQPDLFLILSGWREQEALTLKWSSVDLDRGVAVLADTKTKRSERPLGAAALDVLRSMPNVEGNLYVSRGSPSHPSAYRVDRWRDGEAYR